MCAGVGPGHPTPGQDRSSDTERPLKFGTPVVTHVVDRARLRTRLAHGVGVGTVLVAAPAGWGKTSWRPRVSTQASTTAAASG